MRTKKQERIVTRTMTRAMNTPADRETRVRRLPIRVAFASLFFGSFGGLAGLALLTAPSARAEESAPMESTSSTDGTTAPEPPTCEGVNMEVGTGKCADVVTAESHSRSSASSKVVSVNGVSINSSTTVLARIQAKGATQAQMRGRKVKLPRSMCLATSYKAYKNGTYLGVRWHNKCYARGKVLIWGSDGWYHDPLCWNKVKYKTPKRIGWMVYGRIKLVSYFTFQAKATAKADERTTARAKAWCNTAYGHAEGEGSASSSAYAVASGSASGSIRTSVIAAARGAATRSLSDQLSGRTVVQVRTDVRAMAFAKADSEASAKAVCKGMPPEEQPPTFLQFGEFNDLEVNWSDDHCVTVSFPAGHSGTVYWTATYGSFAIRSKPASSGVQVCSTYKAPSEVPTGGTDTITVTVRDNTTGKTVTKTTNPFVIHPTAPHPA